jgi:hypothetical protein
MRWHSPCRHGMNAPNIRAVEVPVAAALALAALALAALAFGRPHPRPAAETTRPPANRRSRRTARIPKDPCRYQRLPASRTMAELASAPRVRRTRNACVFKKTLIDVPVFPSPGCELRSPEGAGAVVNRARSAFTSTPLCEPRRRSGGRAVSELPPRRSLALRPRLTTGVPWTDEATGSACFRVRR